MLQDVPALESMLVGPALLNLIRHLLNRPHFSRLLVGTETIANQKLHVPTVSMLKERVNHSSTHHLQSMTEPHLLSGCEFDSGTNAIVAMQQKLSFMACELGDSSGPYLVPS